MPHKLFQSTQFPESWIAKTPGGNWVCFPARQDGWLEQQPARGLDTIRLREVPLALALNTHIPGAPYTPAILKSPAVLLTVVASDLPPTRKIASRRRTPSVPVTEDPKQSPTSESWSLAVDRAMLQKARSENGNQDTPKRTPE